MRNAKHRGRKWYAAEREARCILLDFPAAVVTFFEYIPDQFIRPSTMGFLYFALINRRCRQLFSRGCPVGGTEYTHGLGLKVFMLASAVRAVGCFEIAISQESNKVSSVVRRSTR